MRGTVIWPVDDCDTESTGAQGCRCDTCAAMLPKGETVFPSINHHDGDGSRPGGSRLVVDKDVLQTLYHNA